MIRALFLLYLTGMVTLHGFAADEPAATATAPLPDELIELKGKYDEAMAGANAPLIQLKESYASRLQLLKDEEQEKGNLEGVVLIQKEMERLKTEDPDSGSPFEPLRNLQSVYHKYAGPAAERTFPDRVRVEDAYVGALNDLVAQFTKDGELESAIAAREVLKNSELRLVEWKRLAALGMTSGNPFEVLDWTKLAQLISEKRLSNTDGFGPLGADPASFTRDLPEQTALLVGFDLYLNPYGDSDETVRRIIPLFQTESGNTFEGIPRANAQKGDRKRVIAKKGYVVSGVETFSEAGIRKMKITFQRISGLRTTDRDSYDSGWIGKWEGGQAASMTTGGRLPVGVDGFIGLGIGETQLIVVDP
ncbi:MAG: hypothetical protein KDN20_12820 [Verrucomicrobiae bacterium]|nr:hypothetical protein [Verrucomicrobiae bacterium]